MRGERRASAHRARQRRRVHRIGHSERGPAVPTRAAKVNAKATRAERAMDDALVAGASERDRCGRTAHRGREELLRAAQIAGAVLAGGRGENDGRACTKLRSIDHPREREHGRETAPVVADAWSDQAGAVTLHAQRYATGKHRVEMGADHHWRRVVRACAYASDVSRRIVPHIRECQRAESRGDPFAALTLLT